MNKFCICIPNYNGAEWLKNLNSVEGADIIVMDNASTDDSVEVCQKKGFTVVQNVENVDRTYNWIRCLNFFKNSGYEWMKWLFVGDDLSENVVQIMHSAVEQANDASVIVFKYKISSSEGSSIWNSNLAPGLHNHKIVSGQLIKGNNIFGSPIGTMISKRAAALSNIEELHGFVWAADVYMMYQISKASEIFISNQIIGTFNAAVRKHYGKLQNSVNAALEELELIRLIINENKDLPIGRNFEETAVYSYFLRGISYHPKRKIVGKIIRFLLEKRSRGKGCRSDE